jgi:hypothetical protein
MSTSRTIATGGAGGGGSFPAHDSYSSSTAISTTATFPVDTSTPQISEGASTGASVTITVADAASDILLWFAASQVSSSGSQHAGFHVFRDSNNDSVGGQFFFLSAGTGSEGLSYIFTIPAGSTGSTTFTLRYGTQAGTGHTTYVGSLGGTQYHGAANLIILGAMELPP